MRRFAFVLMLLALVSAGCGDDDSGSATEEPAEEPASSDPIIIGAAIAETGFISAFDNPQLEAARIAIEDVNAEGGVLGRQLELVTADTKSDIAFGTNAALEVIEKGADFMIVTADFDFGGAAARVACENDLIAFSLGAETEKFGVQGLCRNAFTAGTVAGAYSAGVAEWAHSELGFRSAYILLDTAFEYPKQLCDGFTGRWAELEGTSIVGEDTFLQDDAAIPSQVTRIENLSPQPDLIFVCSVPPGGHSAVRQIRAAGIDTHILAGQSFDGDYWVDAVPGLSNYHMGVGGSAFGDDPNPVVNEVIAAVNDRIEGQALGNTTQGYALIQSLVRAIERAGTTDTDAVRAELEKFDGEDLLSGPTTYTETVHINAEKVVTIVAIENGVASFVTTIEPKPIELDLGG